MIGDHVLAKTSSSRYVPDRISPTFTLNPSYSRLRQNISDCVCNMAATLSASDAPPLAKFLASTGEGVLDASDLLNALNAQYVSIDKKTRDKATKRLTAFLSEPSRDGLSHAEMAKLWKGIFYCTHRQAILAPKALG